MSNSRVRVVVTVRAMLYPLVLVASLSDQITTTVVGPTLDRPAGQPN